MSVSSKSVAASDRNRNNSSSVFANNATFANAVQGGGRVLRREANDSDQTSPLLKSRSLQTRSSNSKDTSQQQTE